MYLTIILILLIFFSILEVRKNKTCGSRMFYVFILTFYLLSFLRWERGTDWPSYYELYESPFLYGDGSFELPYYGLNILFGTILGLDYTWFLLFQATIIYFYLYKSIQLNCKYWVVALFCSYIILGNGGIFFVRQTIAMCIIFYAYRYIPQKDYKKFFLQILFAACFHSASLIALPLIYIYDLKINRRFMYVLALSVFATIFLYKYGLLERFESKLGSYREEGNMQDNVMQFYYGIVNKLVFLAIFTLYHKKDQEECGLQKIFIYSLFLYVFFGSMNITLSRLSNFVAMFQVYQIVKIIERQRLRATKRYAFLVIIIVIMGLRTLFSISPYKNLMVPYKSIFNKELKVEVY